MNVNNRCVILSLTLLILLQVSCSEEKKGPVMFEVLTSERTGLDFANNLASTDSFNLFKYMYFYNGAGVGAGDFNNDGLTDLFFASNQSDNALYLNQGGLRFKNVTAQTGIPTDKAWSTGVSVVDINNDGLLDIYVNRVGKYRILNSHNQFLICQGIENGVPRYVDKAAEYGLDFSGLGTQAAFLDYDLDGDLDIFLLNHSVHENGTFRARREFEGTFHPTSGSRLYRNDGGRFTEVTRESGIHSSAIGYGLGIAVSDINLDGYPDIYIGNDFHENDYLYINQKNGQFRDEAAASLMHTSQYTMGVDVADASNDGFPEIISVDMLPSDPYILKRSLGEDNFDVFHLKIKYGYNYQYTRNNLQYNRGNGSFSETGLYSGIAATDWSWSPLWMDFDNDGLKDLFISNGIPKRMNDIDYINYVSDQEIQEKIKANKIDERDNVLIDKFPQIKIPNKFYRNKGNMQFADLAENIGNDLPNYSNGAVYADLDNDGDLDVVVNNIDEDAFVYKNTLNDGAKHAFVQLKLKGPESNRNAIGSRVIVYSGKGVSTYEKYPVRGFLSSMEIPIHIGLDSIKVDSALLVWPDNTFQHLDLGSKGLSDSIAYKKGLPSFDFSAFRSNKKNASFAVQDITDSVGLHFLHSENAFPEFDREPLMPHMVSGEGPAVATGDFNGDGFDDVFIGSSKTKKNALFIKQPSGKFVRSLQPELERDSSFEDVDAVFADVNGDTHMDLVIASGGNEYFGSDKHLLPRVYLNDGKGELVRKADAFDKIFQTAGALAMEDINGDGFIDIFIGGRAVPREYGRMPPSYLLLNDGKGRFGDVTAQYCKELSSAGFVTKAVWSDIDNDGKRDLLVSSEWGGIDVYLNKSGRLEKKALTDKKGWWNFILPLDVDGDGDTDLVAGNLGLNSRLRASGRQPVRMYYNDFDDNGKKEQVLTYYLDNKEIPFANKAEIERQLPVMRKRFLYAEDFARAGLNDIFTTGKLDNAVLYMADYFQNSLLLNKGNLNFEVQPLPWQAQLTPFRDGVVIDANGDKLPDVMLAGNYYYNNIEMGRYDADFGSLLLNNGRGGFNYEKLNGIAIKGEVRAVRKLGKGIDECVLVARNNDSAMVIRFTGKGDQ